ncbi:uncharacterized protein B0I36DRAFT_436736 [Microdochium trichocladiopsis]|uniref:Uncharacterized protein n=1 Tax=Microdochium trichocladiopsis TaxID=1682393 RepID=A0A9P8XQD7_9PEZI|nr:uncharacterized protein B0I36DRAFT_436736 [Microdochium trichocladiopsis]KAH7012054.1 hypothetical protein B0I36DRAFT_436736 [Microdochium trichocladiopsis]
MYCHPPGHDCRAAVAEVVRSARSGSSIFDELANDSLVQLCFEEWLRARSTANEPLGISLRRDPVTDGPFCSSLIHHAASQQRQGDAALDVYGPIGPENTAPLPVRAEVPVQSHNGPGMLLGEPSASEPPVASPSAVVDHDTGSDAQTQANKRKRKRKPKNGPKPPASDLSSQNQARDEPRTPKGAPEVSTSPAGVSSASEAAVAVIPEAVELIEKSAKDPSEFYQRCNVLSIATPEDPHPNRARELFCFVSQYEADHKTDWLRALVAYLLLHKLGQKISGCRWVHLTELVLLGREYDPKAYTAIKNAGAKGFVINKLLTDLADEENNGQEPSDGYGPLAVLAKKDDTFFLKMYKRSTLYERYLRQLKEENVMEAAAPFREPMKAILKCGEGLVVDDYATSWADHFRQKQKESSTLPVVSPEARQPSPDTGRPSNGSGVEPAQDNGRPDGGVATHESIAAATRTCPPPAQTSLDLLSQIRNSAPSLPLATAWLPTTVPVSHEPLVTDDVIGSDYDLGTDEVLGVDGVVQSYRSEARTGELVQFEPTSAFPSRQIAATRGRRRGLSAADALESGGLHKRARREPTSTTLEQTTPATPSAIGGEMPSISEAANEALAGSSAITTGHQVTDIHSVMAPRQEAGLISCSTRHIATVTATFGGNTACQPQFPSPDLRPQASHQQIAEAGTQHDSDTSSVVTPTGSPSSVTSARGTNTPSSYQTDDEAMSVALGSQTCTTPDGVTRTPNVALGLGAPSEPGTELNVPAPTPITTLSPTSPIKILVTSCRAKPTGIPGQFVFDPPGPCQVAEFTPEVEEEDEFLDPNFRPGMPSGYEKSFFDGSTIPSLKQLEEAARALKPGEILCQPLSLTSLTINGRKLESDELASNLSKLDATKLEWPPSFTEPFKACFEELKPQIARLYGPGRKCYPAFYYLECGTVKCPKDALGYLFIPVATLLVSSKSAGDNKIRFIRHCIRNKKAETIIIGSVTRPALMIMHKMDYVQVHVSPILFLLCGVYEE